MRGFRLSLWCLILVVSVRVVHAQAAPDGGVDAPAADAASPGAPTDAPDAESTAAPDAPAAVPPTPPPDAARPPAACTATIDGHVVDKVSHEPIVAATVSLNGQYLGDTDELGRFAATAQCEGAITVMVERADYNAESRTLPVLTGAHAAVELAMTVLDNETIVIRDKAPTPTDMRSTTSISGEALERTRGQSFSESLAEVPGVSQLRSASGMAKPIIRGQYGRRLLLLVDGVRHASQDWGLDHAPEIDPFVAGKLVVVRGASGVRYGPDAIGGAIVVEPPDLLHEAGYAGEVHAVGMTNGRGGSLAARLQGASLKLPGFAWQLEGTWKRTAAASTPDYPLDNTGVAEWNAGATAEYDRGRAEYRVSFLHYHARIGVCSCLRVGSADDFFAQLNRDRPVGVENYSADFAIDRQYQDVTHDTALARARWHLGEVGDVEASYAFQFDHRLEYDIVRQAITSPQYAFRLATHDGELAFEHHPVHLTEHLHLKGSAGLVGRIQQHDYAGLSLIPSYQGYGGGVYGIERLVADKYELEAGVRYDHLARTADIGRRDFLRLVRSGQLDKGACGAGNPDPVHCHSAFDLFSASLGALRQLTDAWSVKLDVSTSSRAPNPDEQYINGNSPTFPVLGLGKPDLGPETTYSTSLTTSWSSARVTAEASAYANLINDYIYFAPAIAASGQPIFDVTVAGSFPRFTTRPVNAAFYGADGGVAVAPVAQLQVGAQVSVVRARDRSDNSYLVFVPADRARGSVLYKLPALGPLHETSLMANVERVRRQYRYDRHADLAPPPAGYTLLGAALTTHLDVHHDDLEIALEGTNLANVRYRDYTSLLRYFADQPGRQLMLRLSIHFNTTKKR